MILLLIVLLSLIEAKERILNTYTITIEADATKANGKSWYISGGAPDLLIKVDGVYLDFEEKRKKDVIIGEPRFGVEADSAQRAEL